MNAPSWNVNVTDRDESNEIIVHKTLSENSSTNVSASERNIVNENLSQNNYADVSENTITELKDEEHKEPSVTEKLTSYCNIFGCGINLLDRLDVTYQRVFMATSAQEDYYKEMLKNLIKVKNNEGGPLFNEKLQHAVIYLTEEMNVKHKRNINNIKTDDLYQSPIKNKDVSTINDSVYNESDDDRIQE